MKKRFLAALTAAAVSYTHLDVYKRQVLARVQGPRAVMLTGLDQKLQGMKVNHKFGLVVKNVNSYQNSFEMLIKDLTRWKKEGWRVILLSASRTRASRLASDLREYDLKAFCPDPPVGEEEGGAPESAIQDHTQVQPGQILVTHGNLHRGFEYPLIKFVFITEGDMFGVEKKKKRRKKTNYQGKAIQSFSELAVGDYVDVYKRQLTSRAKLVLLVLYSLDL